MTTRKIKAFLMCPDTREVPTGGTPTATAASNGHIRKEAHGSEPKGVVSASPWRHIGDLLPSLADLPDYSDLDTWLRRGRRDAVQLEAPADTIDGDAEFGSNDGCGLPGSTGSSEVLSGDTFGIAGHDSASHPDINHSEHGETEDDADSLKGGAKKGLSDGVHSDHLRQLGPLHQDVDRFPRELTVMGMAEPLAGKGGPDLAHRVLELVSSNLDRHGRDGAGLAELAKLFVGHGSPLRHLGVNGGVHTCAAFAVDHAHDSVRAAGDPAAQPPIPLIVLLRGLQLRPQLPLTRANGCSKLGLTQGKGSLCGFVEGGHSGLQEKFRCADSHAERCAEANLNGCAFALRPSGQRRNALARHELHDVGAHAVLPLGLWVRVDFGRIHHIKASGAQASSSGMKCGEVQFGVARHRAGDVDTHRLALLHLKGGGALLGGGEGATHCVEICVVASFFHSHSAHWPIRSLSGNHHLAPLMLYPAGPCSTVGMRRTRRTPLPGVCVVANVTKFGKKYRAQIRRGGFKASKFFPTQGQAWAWANDVEAQIEAGTYDPDAGDTIGAVIKRYRKMRSASRPIGRRSTEYNQLARLEADLGMKTLAGLTPETFVTWARGRSKTAKPTTIKADVSKLATVFRYASDKVPDALARAIPKLAHLRLIGDSDKRARRPQGNEMELIIEWVERNKGKKYADAFRFAAITAMRRGEIVALKRSDVDAERRLVRVMRKHPKLGKTEEWVPLIGDSMQILMAQPVDEARDPERFFPFPAAALSKHFNAACVGENIVDLRMHDLRHEGISKLFEQGLAIQHVALVSGHKDWKHLKRYTNLRPESVHDLMPPRPPVGGTRPDTPPSPDSHTSDDPPRPSTS